MVVLEFLKSMIDNFGAPVIVPIIIGIIALILRVKPQKAFLSGLYAAVSLEGISLMLGSFTPIISPLVQNMGNVMVHVTGVKLNVFDVGWQAASLVAFSTSAGMIYLGLGILIQTILFLVKWTKCFQASDLWNNYSYMVWGAMVIYVTGSYPLGIACMVLLNLYSLLVSDMFAKRWSTYYQYPNCTIIAMHSVESGVFGAILDPIYNLIGLNKVKFNPSSIQNKIGFLGEPMTIGFLLGALIGLLGNITKLGTMEAWGSILVAAVATSAVMAIFPKITGFFSQAFAPITDAARKVMGKRTDQNWYIAVNDAVGYGEPATLTCGLLIMPIIILIAFFLPGNQTLPVVDLVALPYAMEVLVAIHNGNMAKVLITSAIYFGLGLLMCSYTAPLFTEVAVHAGYTVPAGSAMITSFVILGKPLIGFVMLAFLTKNPLWIGLTVVVYAIWYVVYRKNSNRFDEYLELQAEKNVQ